MCAIGVLTPIYARKSDRCEQGPQLTPNRHARFGVNSSPRGGPGGGVGKRPSPLCTEEQEKARGRARPGAFGGLVPRAHDPDPPSRIPNSEGLRRDDRRPTCDRCPYTGPTPVFPVLSCSSELLRFSSGYIPSATSVSAPL